MRSETGSRCTGMLLLALATMGIIANLLLCFPNGQVLEITDLVWFFYGFLGAGLLVRTRLSYLASSKSQNNHLILGPLSLGPRTWLALSLCSPQHRTHKHSVHGTANIYLCALKKTAQVSFTFVL